MLDEKNLIRATYLFGVLLPGLETLRRGTQIDYWPSYADDFLIGAFLLFAARQAQIGKPYGPVLLIVPWAVLCGGFYSSFTGQFLVASDVSGINNVVVIAIKGVLYAAAIYLCASATVHANNVLRSRGTQPPQERAS